MFFDGCGAAVAAALEVTDARDRGAHAQKEGTRLADARELAMLARLGAWPQLATGVDGTRRGARPEGWP